MTTPATTEKPTVLRPPTKAAPPPEHPAVRPTVTQTLGAPKPFLNCQIETMPNGEGVATIVIPAEVLKRLKMKAQGLQLGEYVWDVLKRAMYAETF
jgi:hypothetical protein